MSATTLNRIILFLSFVGIFIAGVLSLAHILNVAPPCSVVKGCLTVAQDPSSTWPFGIPVAWIGFGGYGIIGLVSLLRAARGSEQLRLWNVVGLALTTFGTLVSLGFTAYSLTVIKATCEWCLASAITMTILFVAHILLARRGSEALIQSPFESRFAIALGVVAVVSLSVEGSVISGGTKLDIGTTYKNYHYEDFVPKGANLFGSPDAKVTIVEFGDLMCPSCRRHYPELKKIVQDSKGQINLVFRHFPIYNLPGHEESVDAATLSEIAAEHGKFWVFVDAVYDLPEESVQGLSDLRNPFNTTYLDFEKSSARLGNTEDPAFKQVYSDIVAGHHFGVQATPSFFVVARGQAPQACSFEDMASTLQSPPFKALIHGK